MTETTIHDAVSALGHEQPNTYELAVLHALQGKPFYYGTVDSQVKARRRAKNKTARQSRKTNRRK